MYSEEKGEGEAGQAARGGETPAIGITFQQEVGDKRSLVFQSFVAADCRRVELNGMLDKLRIASERQKAIIELPTTRGILDGFRARLEQETEKYRALEIEKSNLHSRWDQEQKASGRRIDRPNQQQIAEGTRSDQALATCRSNINQLREAIAVEERNVTNLEKLISEGG
jgi:hypothetical protein